ncbi:MAG: ANTAR domain-containing protein [Ruminococcus sp.]|nr:ANTAR domain-containing protein [Ruminococcus sp.]
MSLKERNYSVLIVSNAPKFSASLCKLLEEEHCFTIETEQSVSAARRRVLEQDFDLVFITVPLPDENGVSFSIDLCTEKGCVAALFVASEYYEQIFSHVSPYGVYVLPRPLPTQLVSQALDWMQSTRERLRGLEKKSSSLEQKMQEIRTINRAKWLLISERSMTEEQAHKYLERAAMDRCVTKLTIAEEIIGMFG